jgi:beta-glucosidase/6-phospho-beta-glucosidase/beta-galactosidase
MHQIVDGTLSGGVNQVGIDHYNSVINELLKNGEKPCVRFIILKIQISYYLLLVCACLTLSVVNVGIEPFVTLMHFDMPQALEDDYGGLLSRLFMYASSYSVLHLSFKFQIWLVSQIVLQTQNVVTSIC